MDTPKRLSRPSVRPLRLADSTRGRAAVAVGGALLALTQLYACSSQSPLPPPPASCTERCEPLVASGGQEANGGGLPTASDSGAGGTFTDVNPPTFDGNVLNP